MLPNLEDRSKKSQNMTECVPVPSSEHVAEIVGRQGKRHLFCHLMFQMSHMYGNTTFTSLRETLFYGHYLFCLC